MIVLNPKLAGQSGPAELLAGTLPAVGSFSASLRIRELIQGSITASASFSADLRTPATMAASLSAQAAMSGSLAVSAEMQGEAFGTATFTASLSSGSKIEGDIDAVATFSAGLKISEPIAGTSAGVASLSAALRTGVQVAGSLASAAAFAAALKTGQQVAGSMAGAAALSAYLHKLRVSGGYAPHAYYKFEDAGGGIPSGVDSSGNGNDITMPGHVSATNLANGKHGKCLTGGVIGALAADLNLTVGSTIVMWVKISGFSNYEVAEILASIATPSPPKLQISMALQVYPDAVAFSTTLSGVGSTPTAVAAAQGQWGFIAIKRDSTTVRTSTGASWVTTLSVANTHTFADVKILPGITSFGRSISVDSVMKFNRALTDAELSEIYNAGNGLPNL